MTGGDYDGGLAQAVEEMRRLAEATERGEPPAGHGQAADGMVTVTASGGRLTNVEISPKAMRLPSQELAEALTSAVNAALADLESKYPALPVPPIDAAKLEAQLAEAHDQGLLAMRRYTDSIADSLARFGK